MLQDVKRDGESNLPDLYGPEYYASHCGPVPYARNAHWTGFFGNVADVVIRSFAPRTVFDAGCAIGLLVEAFWDRGVEAHGRDFSEWAIGQVRADVRSWCEVGSIADTIGADYDLVTCIEVLEHMPEADAIRAVQMLAAAAPRILFSSSPTDLDEPTHINVRPSSYWLSLWSRAGFAPSVTHDAGYLAPHAYLLERSEEGRSERDVVAFSDRVRHRVALAQVGSTMHAAQAQVVELRRQVTEIEGALGVSTARFEALQQKASEIESILRARAEAAEMALREATENYEWARTNLDATVSELSRARELAAEDADRARALVAASRSEADQREIQRRYATSEAEAAKAELSARRAELVAARHDATNAQANVASARSEVVLLRNETDTARELRDQALFRATAAEAEAAEIRGRIEAARRDAMIARADRRAIENSTTWIATTPVRRVARILPRSVRRRVRQGVFLVSWVATLQIFRHLNARKLMLARARRIEASRYFDAGWYTATYPDVASSGLSPAVHYSARGGPDGRDPGPAFHTPNYLERYPDAANEPGGVFLHAISNGFSATDLLPKYGSARFFSPLAEMSPQAETPSESEVGTVEAPSSPEVFAVPEVRPPTVDALLETRFPDLSALPVFAAPHASQRRLTIVTDSINSGSLYGGVGTALILGALAAHRLKASLRLVTRIEVPEVENVGAVLEVHGIPWSGNIEFLHAPRGGAPGGKDIPASNEDLFLTTSWWTTWAARQSVSRSRIAYLLQEDERMFYPLGDDYLRCTETLSDPGLCFLVNSELLLSHLGDAGLAPGGTAFEPSFPARVYYPSQARVRGAAGKRGFFFYARPHNPRNLYWRGVEALSAAIEENVLNPDEWDFHFAGHGAGPVSLPRGATALFPGPMAWTEYAAMARRMDVGLCLMYTPHPSYPPLDLAASGAVVVTNRFGPKHELDRYSPNILCADPDVPSLVAALRRATSLAADERTRAANFNRSGLQRDWAASVAPALDRLVAWAEA